MKVLIAADGSEHSHDVVRMLKRLNFPARSEIVLLNVLEDFKAFAYGEHIRDHVHEILRNQRREQAGNLLEELESGLRENGFQLRTEIREGHVATQIIQLAEQEGSDLVVVGSRGHSAVERFLLGSTSEAVLNRAPCSVLISRPGDESREEQDEGKLRPRILLCWDGSPGCQDALEELARLPFGHPFEVRVVTVLPLVKSYRMDVLQELSAEWREEQEAAQEAVQKAARHLDAAGYDTVSTLVREGDDVTEELLHVARYWHADIMMVGSSGKSKFNRLLLGSVSTRVSRHASCAVWVVRSRSGDRTD